jgi:flagellar hook-length control protein FliK
MAVTTVNSTSLDVGSIMSVATSQKGKNTVDTSQDFGAVLDNATQSTNTKQDTKTSKSDNKAFDVGTDNKQLSQDESVKEEPVSEETDDTAKDVADDATIEEIATALENIINQIKEILNVDDDEIAVAMEDLGLTQGDLLNTDNLASLVTSLAGEDSIISLVTNEDLYTSLKALTEVVDTHFSQIIDNTDLSQEELKSILEKFEAMNNSDEINQVADTLEEAVGGSAENVEEAPNEDEPVVIIQDNTIKSTQNTLPENQQDTSDLKNDSQSSDNNSKTTKNQNNNNVKDYSENQTLSASQAQKLNEAVAEVTDTVTSYTSVEDTQSLMRQLADAVKIIRNEDMTQMELQLHPANLGTVNISIVTKGGLVTAQFTTQSEQVKAAIEMQATQLQTNLENQGVKVEAIEVAVESHEMERNLDKDNSRREKEGEQAQDNIRATRRANINLRTLGEDGGDLLEEIQGADDATRIAMELMSAKGNSMDLQA